jgi:hypothetical protein
MGRKLEVESKGKCICGGVLAFFGVVLAIVSSAVLKPMILTQVADSANKAAVRFTAADLEDWKTVPKATDSHLTYEYYLWNLTNPDDYLNGSKPIVKKVGPYKFDKLGASTYVVEDKVRGEITYDGHAKYPRHASNQDAEMADKITFLELGYWGGLQTALNDMGVAEDSVKVLGAATLFKNLGAGSLAQVVWGEADAAGWPLAGGLKTACGGGDPKNASLAQLYDNCLGNFLDANNWPMYNNSVPLLTQEPFQGAMTDAMLNAMYGTKLSSSQKNSIKAGLAADKDWIGLVLWRHFETMVPALAAGAGLPEATIRDFAGYDATNPGKSLWKWLYGATQFWQPDVQAQVFGCVSEAACLAPVGGLAKIGFDDTNSTYKCASLTQDLWNGGANGCTDLGRKAWGGTVAGWPVYRAASLVKWLIYEPVRLLDGGRIGLKTLTAKELLFDGWTSNYVAYALGMPDKATMSPIIAETNATTVSASNTTERSGSVSLADVNTLVAIDGVSEIAYGPGLSAIPFGPKIWLGTGFEPNPDGIKSLGGADAVKHQTVDVWQPGSQRTCNFKKGTETYQVGDYAGIPVYNMDNQCFAPSIPYGVSVGGAHDMLHVMGLPVQLSNPCFFGWTDSVHAKGVDMTDGCADSTAARDSPWIAIEPLSGKAVGLSFNVQANLEFSSLNKQAQAALGMNLYQSVNIGDGLIPYWTLYVNAFVSKDSTDTLNLLVSAAGMYGTIATVILLVGLGMLIGGFVMLFTSLAKENSVTPTN